MVLPEHHLPQVAGDYNHRIEVDVSQLHHRTELNAQQSGSKSRVLEYMTQSGGKIYGDPFPYYEKHKKQYSENPKKDILDHKDFRTGIV